MGMDTAIFIDWMSFAARWLHVVTGIAWIGSSFYFIALDLGLRKSPDLPEGVHGEEWQVHGGGFYHVRKYLVAPPELPEHLIWFKWEAYSAWLSGFVLLAIVYYVGADLFLVDPEVLDISTSLAIAISVGSIAFGWIAYDLICKSKFGDDNTRLMIFLYILLVAMAWGYTQVFSGRAALLHLGAFTATIMSANVFFAIIPNQKIVIADLKAGRTPHAKHGAIGKQRSVHNNYLTLPVLFLMLSNHYPLAFATEYNWIIASLVFLMGVVIRHYFNSVHAGQKHPVWPWPAAIALFIVIMWLSTVPKFFGEENAQSQHLAPYEERFVVAANFDAVRDVVAGRCSMCHASEPVWAGIVTAPKGVKFETDKQIAQFASQIYLQAGRSHAMPPANVSFMEEGERELIVKWYQAALDRTSP
jgi:uncharacterized membrane protein